MSAVLKDCTVVNTTSTAIFANQNGTLQVNGLIINDSSGQVSEIRNQVTRTRRLDISSRQMNLGGHRNLLWRIHYDSERLCRLKQLSGTLFCLGLRQRLSHYHANTSVGCNFAKYLAQTGPGSILTVQEMQVSSLTGVTVGSCRAVLSFAFSLCDHTSDIAFR